MMNVPYYAQDIIKGSILITALAFSFIKRSVIKSRASNSMLYFPLQQSHELLSKQEVKDRSLSLQPLKRPISSALPFHYSIQT